MCVCRVIYVFLNVGNTFLWVANVRLSVQKHFKFYFLSYLLVVVELDVLVELLVVLEEEVVVELDVEVEELVVVELRENKHAKSVTRQGKTGVG